MLFEPSQNHRTMSFQIANPCSAFCVKISVTMAKSQRPLDEVFRGFDDLLSKGLDLNDAIDDSQFTFQVSYLNAAIFLSIGQISIF